MSKRLKTIIIVLAILLLAVLVETASWIWWNVPYIYIFHGGFNIVGAVWFVCLLIYGTKRLTAAGPKKLPLLAAFCIAGCLSFLVLYCLDEMSTAIYWPIWGFNYALFLNKIPIYCSFPIASWTVYHFARDYFHIGKKTVAYLIIMAAWYIVMFLVMLPLYGTLSYRVVPDPLDSTIVFWTLYIIPKIFWAQIFLSLWKRGV